MFAEMNVAMGDAAIVAWMPFTYNFWRPITAIQAGGDDSNSTADPTWEPLINTPPFPEYISGHSTFASSGSGGIGWGFRHQYTFYHRNHLQHT